MSIISYSGRFGRDEQVVGNTTVHWQCDLCGRVGQIRYDAYRLNGDLCGTCKKHGLLPTESDVIAKYACVIAAVTLNAQGRIRTSDFVLAQCVICNERHKTRYQNVLFKDGAWNCKSCARFIQFGENLLLPDDLPDFVLDYEKDTLGSMGRVIAQTVVYTECPNCNKIQKRSWYNALEHGQTRCKGCATSDGWESGIYDQHGAKLTELWKTDGYRKATLENRKDNGYISGLHADVKQALVEYGITGFESERYVAGSHRVDELDAENKIVLEVYGDYWHCNPARFDKQDSVTRDEKQVPVRDVWERDRKRISHLQKFGYKVYIIWEMDFRTDPERSIQEFAEWLGDLESIKIGRFATAA